MPEERPQEEIDLWELFSVLWHWRKVLLAFVVIGTLLAGGVAYLIPNTYQSEAKILPLGGEGSKLLTYTLTKSATGFSGMASLGNLALQNARSEILGALSGQSLYLDIVEKYHLTQRISAKTPQEAAEKLRKMVSFQDDPKTGVIVIRVKGRTPQEAKELGEYVLTSLKENLRNSFVNSLQNQINKLDKIMASTKDTYVLNKLENMKLNLLEELLEAQIDPDWKFKVVDPPSTPVAPSSPKRLLILGVGFIGSLFLGIFVVLLMEYVKSRRGASP